MYISGYMRERQIDKRQLLTKPHSSELGLLKAHSTTLRVVQSAFYADMHVGPATGHDVW